MNGIVELHAEKQDTILKKWGQINGAFCFHLPSSLALPRSSFLVSSFRTPVPQPNLLLYKQG